MVLTPTSPAEIRIYPDEGGLFISAGFVGQSPTKNNDQK
jgi:hypothetical protein